MRRILFVAVLAILLPGFALAQDRAPTPRPAPNKIGGPAGQVLDNLGVKPLPGPSQGTDEGTAPASTVTVGGAKFNLTDDLIAKVLPDLTYAAALSHQNNNVITAPCFDALLKLVQGWNAPVNGADGQPLPMPDPHVLVTLERASELLHQLQPDSVVSVGCGALGQALQKDIATLVGTVLSGGALGLFKLPIAIP